LHEDDGFTEGRQRLQPTAKNWVSKESVMVAKIYRNGVVVLLNPFLENGDAGERHENPAFRPPPRYGPDFKDGGYGAKMAR